MKYLIPFFAILCLTPAYAQLENFDIIVPQIENPKDCMQSEIRGGKGWVPFSIKMFYDTTKAHVMSVEHQGGSNPIIQQSDNVMVFQSGGIDTYQLSTQLNYEETKKRAIYFEYWSEGNVMHSEIINYEADTFCRTFLITTTEPPNIPTAEEMLGEHAYRALTEMPLIKDAINSNTSAMNGALAFMLLIIVFSLFLGFAQLITYRLRKKNDRKQIQLFEEAIRNANETTKNTTTILDKVDEKGNEMVKKLTDRVDGRIDGFVNSTNSSMIDLKAIIEFFKKESDIYDRKKLEIEKEKERLKMPEVDNDPEKMKFEIENMSEKQLRVFGRSLRGLKDDLSRKKLKFIGDIFKKTKTVPLPPPKKKEKTMNLDMNKMEIDELLKIYNDLVRKKDRSDHEIKIMQKAFDEIKRRRE